MSRIKELMNKGSDIYKNMNIAVKASLWFTVCSILQRGISIITMPIFTRIMPTGDYGEYSIFHTWYNIFVIIITLNINSEVFNKGLIENSDCKDYYTTNQACLMILLALMYTIIYIPLNKVLGKLTGLSVNLTLIMILEILGNGIIILWSARQRFDFNYRKIIAITLVTSILSPIIGIIAVLLSENKVLARICANAAVYAFVGFFLLVCIVRKSNKKINYSWWKTSILLSLPLVPHYLSLVLLNQSDKLMINYFIDSEHAAIYSVAHSAGLLMVIVNTSINGSFVPWSYTKLKNEDGKGIKQISNYLYAIVVFSNSLLIWFAPEAIRLLAAPQYADAVWCLVPIAASVYFFFVYTLFVDVEIYFGGTKYVAIASVVAASLNLLLNYIFIPKYGFIAAGYTTLISYFATMLLHCLFMNIILKKNSFDTALFDYRIIAVFSLLMVLICGIALFVYKLFLVRLIIAIVCFCLAYAKREIIIDIFRTMKRK